MSLNFLGAVTFDKDSRVAASRLISDILNFLCILFIFLAIIVLLSLLLLVLLHHNLHIQIRNISSRLENKNMFLIVDNQGNENSSLCSALARFIFKKLHWASQSHSSRGIFFIFQVSYQSLQIFFNSKLFEF